MPNRISPIVSTCPMASLFHAAMVSTLLLYVFNLVGILVAFLSRSATKLFFPESYIGYRLSMYVKRKVTAPPPIIIPVIKENIFLMSYFMPKRSRMTPIIHTTNKILLLFIANTSNKLWLFGVSPYSHILLRYSLHLVAC